MDQKKIGTFLKELRKEKGITQEQLAEKLNVSGRSVSRWETGNNMPDISLLVEIADFYGVDVREIIEGEKSEMMDKEVRDVANKMADYANNEKSRLFKVVRLIGIVGVIFLGIAIVFQCIKYEPGIVSFASVLLSFVAFIAMIILTLYVNGILQKLKKNKAVTIIIAVLMFIVFAVCARFVLMFFIAAWVILFELLAPVKTGNDEYNKAEIVAEYHGDMNSSFFVFPDNLDNAKDSEYAYSAKTGLFDTDGYFILKVSYDEEEYEKEIERISDISCEVKKNDGSSFTNYILYDENMYNYPAYIAVDGYDNSYEYALLDEENQTIIYVALSYPEGLKLDDYKDYLKKDKDDYSIEIGTSLDRFNVYAHHFDGDDYWVEY